MDFLFVGVTGLVALYALGNWRAAIYACILLDVLRDPARKLTEHQSSFTTVVVGVVWLAALIGALTSEGREARTLFRRYPQLRSSLVALVIALLPGTMISVVYYNNGWVLATIGIASYSAPFLGVVIGYLWVRRTGDVYAWMKVYVLVNAVFLVGSIFEAYGFDIAGLGGMNMKWVRNYGTDFINLVCGFYRSPDVMGLHAAHVIMCAALLAMRPRERIRWFWFAVCIWASVSLILCGRRKMISIPLVFLFVNMMLIAINTGRKQVAILTAIVVGLGLAGLRFASDGGGVENEYARFAGSIASEGVERAGRSFTEITFTTIRQSGWMGDGLGTVTQGRQYMGVVTNGKDWQEDGIGRLFKELGVPGVISILISAGFLLYSMRISLESAPTWHPVVRLQYGSCAMIAANAASFSVSHQAYSGDPSTVLMVGFFLGIVLGLPRTVWRTGRSSDLQMKLTERPIAVSSEGIVMLHGTHQESPADCDSGRTSD